MLKALAAVRTVYLVFIVAMTIRAMPYFVTPPRTFDETYSRCAEAQGALMRAAWYAVAWIALETVIGWILALRRKGPVAQPAPAAPPPPPRP